MAWTNVQAGASVHLSSNTSITLTTSATTAGNLVVCTLAVGFSGPGTGTGGSYFTTVPSGFLLAKLNQPGNLNDEEIWYNPSIGAGLTSFVFSSTGATHSLDGQPAEYNSGVASPTIVVNDTGTGSGSSTTSLSATFGGTSVAGDLVTMGVAMTMTAGTTTYTSPGSWTTVSTSGATSAAFHSAASYLLNSNTPGTVTATAGSSQTSYTSAGASFHIAPPQQRAFLTGQAVNRASTY